MWTVSAPSMVISGGPLYADATTVLVVMAYRGVAGYHVHAAPLCNLPARRVVLIAQVESRDVDGVGAVDGDQRWTVVCRCNHGAVVRVLVVLRDHEHLAMRDIDVVLAGRIERGAHAVHEVPAVRVEPELARVDEVQCAVAVIDRLDRQNIDAPAELVPD